MILTTRWRLTLIAVVVLMAVLAVLDLAVLKAADLVVSYQTQAGLATEVDLMARGMRWDGARARLGDQPLPLAAPDGTPLEVDLVGLTGLLYANREPALPDPLVRSLAAEVRRGHGLAYNIIPDVRGETRRVGGKELPPETAGPGAVVLVSGRGPTGFYDGLRWLPPVMVLSSLAVLLAGGLATYWTAGRALRPVSGIAAFARELSERDLHRRVDVAVPKDELRELVMTFNAMLDRLERSISSLRGFTADASHELRAPLALMRAEVEVALAAERSDAEYQRVLRSLDAEIGRLARIADHLLLLARSDARTLTPSAEPIWLAELLDEAADRWRPVLERRQIEMVVEAPAEGHVAADRMLLRRLVDNLLDNAVRHTPRGGRIHARGAFAGSCCRIEIEDTGPGIAAADRAKVFVRFARLDGARTREAGGAGLGLAICAAIAEAHGGSIAIASAPETGARFVVSLPERPPARQPARGRP